MAILQKNQRVVSWANYYAFTVFNLDQQFSIKKTMNLQHKIKKGEKTLKQQVECKRRKYKKDFSFEHSYKRTW